MEFLELVKRRYSCRNYQSKPVEQGKLDYIMECVRLAPSAVNRQPWRFRIVSSEEGRKKHCMTKSGCAQMASIMAISTLQLPLSIFVLQQRSKESAPVGYVTSMPSSASLSSHFQTTRKLLSSSLLAIRQTN